MTLKYIFQETGLSAKKAAWWKSSPGFSHAAFFKMIFLHVRYQLFRVIIARYLHLQGNSLLSSIAHFLKHCTQQSFSLFFMHNRAFRHSPSWFAAANCLKQDRLQAHALYKYRFSVHWQSYFQPGRQSPFHLSQHFLNILPFQHACQTDSSIFPAGCHSFTACRILALFAWHHSTTNVSHTDRLSTALLSIPLPPGEFSCYFAITAFHDCRQAYGQSIHSCLPFACWLKDSHVTRRGISTNKTSEFYACRTWKW